MFIWIRKELKKGQFRVGMSNISIATKVYYATIFGWSLTPIKKIDMKFICNIFLKQTY